jgi:Mce-associated membrane protein
MRESQATQPPRPHDAGQAGGLAPQPASSGSASGPRLRDQRGPLARGPLALGVLSVLLAVVGAGLTVRAAQLRDSPAAANRAFTDAAATSQVIAAVSTGVSEIYSYSYTDLAATPRAADRVLAGQAAAQYRQLAPELSQAVTERLTVVTRVTRIGVSSLTPDSARLLVFLDQTATRGAGKTGKSSTVPAQLDVIARLSGGTWRITNIESR